MNNVQITPQLTLDLVSKSWEEVQTYAQQHQEFLPLWLFATCVAIGLIISSRFYGISSNSN